MEVVKRERARSGHEGERWQQWQKETQVSDTVRRNFSFLNFLKKFKKKFMLQFQDVKILSLCSRNDDLSIKVASLTGKYRIIFTQGSTLLRQNN